MKEITALKGNIDKIRKRIVALRKEAQDLEDMLNRELSSLMSQDEKPAAARRSKGKRNRLSYKSWLRDHLAVKPASLSTIKSAFSKQFPDKSVEILEKTLTKSKSDFRNKGGKWMLK